MNKKLSVLFAITSLNIGGAERVLVDTLNELVIDYDITLLLLYGNGILEPKLSKDIKKIIIEPKSPNQLSSMMKRYYSVLFSSNWLLKRKVKQLNIPPQDIQIAYLEGPMTFLVQHLQRPSVRRVAWIHIDLFAHTTNKYRLNQHLKAYESYDSLAFVSPTSLEHFKSNSDINKPLLMIPNYISDKKVRELVLEPCDIIIDKTIPTFVSVTRLVDKHKGILRYIDVVHRLKQEGYEFKVYHVGGGPDQELIEKRIKALDVTSHFILLGEMQNPFPIMNQADYFTLFSYYEGAPIVLHEAKIMGKYILTTSTSGDVLLTDYPYAKIVSNDEASIYNLLKSVLTTLVKVDTNYQYNNQNALQILKQSILK